MKIAEFGGYIYPLMNPVSFGVCNLMDQRIWILQYEPGETKQWNG